jgi:ribosome recycling factor
MSSLLRRHSLRLRLSITQTQTITRPTPLPSLLTAANTTTPRRAYASSNKKAKHGQKGDNESTLHTHHASKRARAPIATTSLTPGSQQTLNDPTAREEFARADAKMAGCVEWLRREVSQLEARASGRVTPQLLAPVRVSVSSVGPSAASSAASASSEAKKGARLEELATVGVRDGTTLIVTVFDPHVSVVVLLLLLLFCPLSCRVDAVSFPPNATSFTRSYTISGRVHWLTVRTAFWLLVEFEAC